MFDVARFLSERRPLWDELQSLVQIAEAQGVQSLGLERARRLAKLYRVVSSDLLRLRSELADAVVVDHVNDLIARAYAQVHAPAQASRFTLVTFFTQTYPQLFRKELKLFVVAFSALFIGASIGAVGMKLDPGATTVLVPEDHQWHSPNERIEQDRERGVQSGQQASSFTTMLFTNNIRVSFTAFALGILAGAGTLAALFYNGVPLGALAMQYHMAGRGTFFWAWILPHGIPEITAICIGGMAGLMLGRGLLSPGRRSRKYALAHEAKQGVLLVLGTMPMFILAGIIEGTISQIHPPHISFATKLTTAALVGAAVYAYLLLVGRNDDQRSLSEP